MSLPYIKPEERLRLQPVTNLFENVEIKSTGELNYLITLLVHRYLNQMPENYQSYNDAVGALEAAKLELYRRHIVEYENLKISQNGDV